MKISFSDYNQALKFGNKLRELIQSEDGVELFGQKFYIKSVSSEGSSMTSYIHQHIINVELINVPKKSYPKAEACGGNSMFDCVLENFVKSGALSEYLETHNPDGTEK